MVLNHMDMNMKQTMWPQKLLAIIFPSKLDIVASQHLAFWCWFWPSGGTVSLFLFLVFLGDCKVISWMSGCKRWKTAVSWPWSISTMSSLWVPLDLGQRQCTMVPPTSICTTMSMVCLAALCFLAFSLPMPSPSGVGIKDMVKASSLLAFNPWSNAELVRLAFFFGFPSVSNWVILW